MLNCDKYIDRGFNQTAAKFLKSVDTVAESLKHCSREEVASYIIQSKCKNQEMQQHTNLGFSQFLPTESLKDLLSPELKKSRFVSFKEKFSEDMYFKKADVGQALAVQSKPQEFTNENFIYGLKNNTSEKLYDLVCPNKTPFEVQQEFLKWHDKYLISHKHYLPSEKIKRNYNDNFNPDALYGIFYNVDRTGHMAKICLQQCDSMVVINNAQKKFMDRTTGQLGQKVDRYNLSLDSNQTFGINTKNKSGFNARTLIENVEPSAEHDEINEAISYINKLRQILYNRSDFRLHDLKILLNKHEENRTSFIKFKSLIKALQSLKINVNERIIRVAISHFKLLKDENETSELVNTEAFCKMLHIQYPLPQRVHISYPNGNCDHKETTYRLLCTDREKNIVPKKMLRKLDDDRNTAGDLIASGISMQYGLSPSVLKVARSKEELKRIFRYLRPEHFDQAWDFACPETYDGDSYKVSISDFRNVSEKCSNQHLNN